MKKICLHLFAVGMGALLVPQLAQAQPTNLNVAVTNSPIIYLGGTNAESIDYSVTNKDGSTVVSVSFPLVINQSGAGIFSSPTKTATVLLDLGDTNGVVTSTNFEGRVAIHGAISSAASHKGHFTATVSAVGKTTAIPSKHGTKVVNRTVFTSENIHEGFDASETTTNVAIVTSGGETRTASASGLGAISQHSSTVGEILDAQNWVLSSSDLTPSANGKKIKGTATATLDSGIVFTFKVNGLVNGKGISTLVLTAGDTATRGSTLRVVVSSTNTISKITGMISGQAVKYP